MPTLDTTIRLDLSPDEASMLHAYYTLAMATVKKDKMGAALCAMTLMALNEEQHQALSEKMLACGTAGLKAQL